MATICVAMSNGCASRAEVFDTRAEALAYQKGFKAFGDAAKADWYDVYIDGDCDAEYLLDEEAPLDCHRLHADVQKAFADKRAEVNDASE